MTRKVIDVGVIGNDGTGDSIREAFIKTNDNFQELYLSFNQQTGLSIVDLTDTPANYPSLPSGGSARPVTLMAVKNLVNQVAFKELRAIGLELTSTDDVITLVANGSGGVVSDPNPMLGSHLNATNHIIGNVLSPGDSNFNAALQQWNQSTGSTILESSVAASVGFSERTYVKKSGGTLTGSLVLHDHPEPMAGKGQSPTELQAATKFYVDNSSFASTVDLFVSTSGNDNQENTPEGMQGRSWAYAFKSIGTACDTAYTLMQSAQYTVHSTAQYITAFNGSALSQVTSAIVTSGVCRLKLTNSNGAAIDQGVNRYEFITPGKMVMGVTSGARGIVTRYGYGSEIGAGFNDYIDLLEYSGQFVVGENVKIGPPIRDLRIVIHVETGEYPEQFPIVVPENVTILGSSSSVVPAIGLSESPAASRQFYRDAVFDDLAVSSSGTPVSAASGSVVGYLGTHYLDSGNNPKDNEKIDAFLLNSGSVLSSLSVNKILGFAAVLDPMNTGLVIPPVVEHVTVTTQSINKHVFSGGIYVDEFSAGTLVTVSSVSFPQITIANSLPSRWKSAKFQFEGVTYLVTRINGTTLTVTDEETFPVTLGTGDTLFLTPATSATMCIRDCHITSDLGYGIVATNGSVVNESRNVLSYCWSSLVSNSGSTILTNSTSKLQYGKYGVISNGSHPFEVPDQIYLVNNQVQVAKVVKTLDTGNAGNFEIYVTGFEYAPFPQGSIVIDHGSVFGVAVYPYLSVISGDEVATGAVKLTLSTNSVGQSAGLVAEVTQNQPVIIMVGTTERWFDVKENSVTSRPTSLTVPSVSWVRRQVVSQSITDSLGLPIRASRPIASITKATVATVTTTGNHGFISGDRVRFRNVVGMIELNNRDYYVTVVNTTSFRIYYNNSRTQEVDSRNFGTFIFNPSSEVVRNGDQVLLETDSALGFEELTVYQDFVTIPYPAVPDSTHGSRVGDTAIAVYPVTGSVIDRLNTGRLLFSFAGKVHRIVGYTANTFEGMVYGRIVISDQSTSGGSMPNLNSPVITGLQFPVSVATNTNLKTTPTLILGWSAGELANIASQVSICQSVGYDFNQVGTGGMVETAIRTGPVSASTQLNERNSGLIFSVSTDQDGIFKVGKFFSINQKTGEVGINAGRLSLDGVAGLKFSRGVRVNEFSTSDDFDDGSDSIVPTQSAIRSYLDRRLGLSSTGGVITLSSRPISPGFIDRAGTLPATGNIRLGGNRIIELADPIANSDAVTKSYVDSQPLSPANSNIVSPTTGSLLVYTNNKWTNALVEVSTDGSNTKSDVEVSFQGANKVWLVLRNNTVVDSQINSSAQIQQSKLALNKATASVPSGVTTSPTDFGVATFNPDHFESINGWIKLKYPLTQTGQANSLVRTSSTGAISGTEFSLGNSTILRAASGSIVGLTMSGYQYLQVSGTQKSNTVMAVAGAVDTSKLLVDGKTAISTNVSDSTILNFTTPGGYEFLRVSGTTISNTQAVFSAAVSAQKLDSGSLFISGGKTIERNSANQLQVMFYTPSGLSFLQSSGTTSSNAVSQFTGELRTTKLSTGATTTVGSIIGNWTLAAGSKLQATYADLAEYYQSDNQYPPGTVVVFGGEYEVTVTNLLADHRVAGVVSANPAYVMNAGLESNSIVVALQGRVPLKVIGKVKKGGLLVTAAKPGFAIAAIDPKIGTVIGKSLEDKLDNGEGVIEVSVGRT